MLLATNIGLVLTSINRNIKAKSPFLGWWLLHCKASFANQRRRVSVQRWWDNPGGPEGSKVEWHLLLADRSERACRLPRKGRLHYLHPHHHSPETSPGATLTSGPPWLLVSQLLFYCFLWFPNRTEELYICFVGKPAYFFTLLFHPFCEALFYFYLLLSFSFKCRIAWQQGVPGK